MECFDTIDALAGALGKRAESNDADAGFCRDILEENRGMLEYLRLLEKTNPCRQRYFLDQSTVVISYEACWVLFSIGKLAFKFRYRVIGMPVSLSNPGCLVAKCDDGSRAALPGLLKRLADSLKGLTIVLNTDAPICGMRMAPPTYVFYNRFSSFDGYLAALRSSYRRKFSAVLEKGKHMQYARLGKDGFTEEHYKLYLSVCGRAAMVFRILPFDYFKCCSTDIFEARDGAGRLAASVQLREIDRVLYFVYVGFGSGDGCGAQGPGMADLYYNLLLFIIRHGIENGCRKIVFGQTSDESKSKVGCTMEPRYMYITSSNPLIRLFFRLFPGFPSFRPHGVRYHVFKE